MNDRHTTTQFLLRQLPSIDQLLQSSAGSQLLIDYGRTLTVEALRHVLDVVRRQILSGEATAVSPTPTILHHATTWLEELLAPTLQPVINATGVIVHTNLGRAPLSEETLTAVNTATPAYATLEYNIQSGKRGSRSVHAEKLLTRLTSAEAALVVNNNAAAVLLMLTALCQGKEVIISRGQLVEIGGGFRIPDVMAQSGAKLVEVGTTNRTHMRDYANVINENTAAILVAHHSNYKIIGFTSEPGIAELAELAHEHGIMLLFDQGSGALLDVGDYGLETEPTILDGLADGADVICGSGDKLLGGPQAGILYGRSNLIQQLKSHPLARAVRADKLCLAALGATLTHYLKDEAIEKIPIWQMIARPLDEILAEAERWAAAFQERGIKAQVVNGRSRVGGGSLPGSSLPTHLVAIENGNVVKLGNRLRRAATPVIARIQDGLLLLDPRTILPGQAEFMLQTVIKSATE